MEGHNHELLDVMNGSMTRFVIPVYQRNYDWKVENCKRLFDDLVILSRSAREYHFFGSVVVVKSMEGYAADFLIIDGQQRMTTVSLLLLALYKSLMVGAPADEDQGLAEHILRSFLVDNVSSHGSKLKLKPIKDDFAAFEKLFGEPSGYITGSNLTINFHYFMGRIAQGEISCADLFSAISRLEIIYVVLKQSDDPQLVFESLNSTGVALTEGDKIRNFVLMGLTPRQQELLYEKYWNKIEECTSGHDVSAFIRDYLSVKTTAIAPQNKVYEAFKTFWQKRDCDAEVLLADMYEYAKLYRTLLIGKTDNKDLNDCIFRLNWLETTVTRPFFLEVLRLETEQKLTTEEVYQIFLTVENYLYRRQICEIPTNALNKIFLVLHKDIVRFDGTTERYFDKFRYAMATKKDRGVFPDDAEFAEAFRMRNVYKMNPRLRAYTLERLENFGTRETTDVYKRIEEETLTIEHVMPQILVPAWIESLGDGYLEIHETWLHRVANLTLTAYNSRYSNNPFEDKLKMKNGFKDSGIRLNHWIAQQSEWGVAQLEARSQILSQQALEMWSKPMADPEFAPKEKERNTVCLDDDVGFRGLQIAAYIFKGVEQPVANWIDAFDAVVRQLHASDKSILAKLAAVNDPDVKLSQYFSVDGRGLREASELDTGVYYERNSNTEIKITILRELFRQFGVSADDLVFVLREMAEDKSSEAVKAWKEMRRRYWTMALPIIRERNKDNGMFSGWNPGEENWCSGFFGIGGVHISCIANYNCVRVELYTSGTSKYSAKELFDFLDAHRVEIDAKIPDAELRWNRGNDIKHARIFVKDDSMSINVESDWERMAKFHAEWSRKFFETLVPYVREFCDIKMR